MSESLVAYIDRLRDVGEGVRVLGLLDERFRNLGATHILVTGLPLPDRPVEPLVLRAAWGELRGDRLHENSIDPRDPLLRTALVKRSVFQWGADGDTPESADAASALAEMIDEASRAHLIVVPIHAFAPYQAVILIAGPTLVLSPTARRVLGLLCDEAFRRLLAIGYFRPSRPGDLSTRERRVVELSALGKTAGEIANLLEISQRTVHAHLQNASIKLRASNKTHTVVEALRYAQIAV